MTTSELRQRPQSGDMSGALPVKDEKTPPAESLTAGVTGGADIGADEHPSGKESHGRWIQILRVLSFFLFFFAGCIAIVLTQLIGAPLYFVNRPLYDSYMALTKQSFGLVITTMTAWWGPTTIRISGDATVADQIRQTPDGLVEFSFPERLVLIANHQIYTDWLYLWWVGYANSPHMHGYLYIILKESLKYIPIIGQGMMFYGFIFMSRKMSVDRPRLAHRLRKLSERRATPDGKKSYLDPMWLLLFPEGTNASGNGRVKSARWAEKTGVRDPAHVLLPRSTGMFFCLSELAGTVEWVYDCTVAYEGIPRGHYGEDYFSLGSMYFQGRPPKSVNFYWRRFRVADIPLADAAEFDAWLRERWYEKDALMERYLETGRFPPSPAEAVRGTSGKEGFVETEVRTRYPWEFLQIYTVVGAVTLLVNIVWKVWARLAAAVSFS